LSLRQNNEPHFRLSHRWLSSANLCFPTALPFFTATLPVSETHSISSCRRSTAETHKSILQHENVFFGCLFLWMGHTSWIHFHAEMREIVSYSQKKIKAGNTTEDLRFDCCKVLIVSRVEVRLHNWISKSLWQRQGTETTVWLFGYATCQWHFKWHVGCQI